MWRDRQLGAALAAGPLVWAALLTMGHRSDLLWPLRQPVAFLIPVLVYPVAEEVVFRGGVQELLRGWFGAIALGPLTAANVLTSLLFAGLHFFYHPPLWAALTVFPSLVFGYFMDRHRRLAAPVLLHVFYNLGFYWLFG